MADIKSLETLLAELRTFIRALNRRLDTGDNSLSKDFLLTPFSVGGKAIMDQVEIARGLGILSRLESGDLDNEATNYKKERLPGSYSVVTLTFYSSTAPTTDVVIPAGTQAQTSGTTFVSPVSFSTVSEARFTVSDADSYFSYDRNRYEWEVTALCDEIGTVGNIGSELINQLIGSIGGVEGVTNLTAATGGLDEEEDDDFRTRIQLAKTGRDLNTVNGLRLYMRDLGFLDAYPVRIEDADAEKATGIDVFVINNSSEAFIDIFTYDPSQEKYYLTKRPVLEVTSVVGSNKGNLGASDYDAMIDNTSPLRRSIYAQDYLTFDAAAGLLYGETITVQYNYAPLIIQAQENLGLNENDVLIVNGLFGEGIYDKLVAEMEACGVDPKDLWKLWHGDSHTIADDKLNWKKNCPTFDMVIKRIKGFFEMDVKATRFNLYKDSSDWKPLHHDAAAVKKDKAATQNFTVGCSFGLEREAIFEHAKHRTTISLPLPDGSVYCFGKDVNVQWRHGIRQYPPDQHVDQGRISVIAWGWTDQMAHQ